MRNQEESCDIELYLCTRTIYLCSRFGYTEGSRDLSKIHKQSHSWPKAAIQSPESVWTHYVKGFDLISLSLWATQPLQVVTISLFKEDVPNVSLVAQKTTSNAFDMDMQSLKSSGDRLPLLFAMTSSHYWYVAVICLQSTTPTESILGLISASRQEAFRNLCISMSSEVEGRLTQVNLVTVRTFA